MEIMRIHMQCGVTITCLISPNIFKIDAFSEFKLLNYVHYRSIQCCRQHQVILGRVITPLDCLIFGFGCCLTLEVFERNPLAIIMLKPIDSPVEETLHALYL